MSRDDFGQTPLHYAVRNGNKVTLGALLKARAELVAAQAAARSAEARVEGLQEELTIATGAAADVQRAHHAARASSSCGAWAAMASLSTFMPHQPDPMRAVLYLRPALAERPGTKPAARAPVAEVLRNSRR